MGAFSRSNSGSGSFNVPSVVQRAWVSCIGGGANGQRGGGDGGGGGGWGRGDRPVSSTSISYSVGGRGQTSSCLGVSGGGASGRSGGGFSGPGGEKGKNGNRTDHFSTSGSRGGAAGGRNGGGNRASFIYSPLGTGLQILTSAGGGGNGNDGFGNAGGNGKNATFNNSPNTLEGGNGGNYGGGGGGWSANDLFVSGGPGEGRGGFVYVSWIDLTAGATTLRSGQSTTVSWNSPVDSGSQTVSYTNNGTSNITQTYTRTDSRGAKSSITFTILPAVRINSFSANPNPQTSGLDGIPNYNTTLSWTTAGATSASITNIGSVSANGSTTVTNLPQSVAGTTSPATRTYTLTASDGFNTVTSPPITVSAFNDNDRGSFSISNQTNLEPNTVYVVNVGQTTSSQIDMITAVSGLNGATVAKNGSGSFSSTIFISPGDIVGVRFLSAPFNQDPNGLTNTVTYGVQIGPRQAFFTATTRAPIVKEIFNYPNYNTKVPFPDIDTIETAPDHPAKPFIETASIAMDDIELANPYGVEIKSSNQNIQMRKRISGSAGYTDWIDIRKI